MQLNVHSRYFSFTDEDLIAVAGTSVRSLMCSSRGLAFFVGMQLPSLTFFF